MTDEGEGDRTVHLIIDGPAKNRELMVDNQLMDNFLRRLVDVCGMTIVAEPVIVGFPWPGSDDEDAISAVAFLKESAIMVHCYPEQSFIFVDVFSCRDFDVNSVYHFVQAEFDMPRAVPLLLNRGINEKTGACIPASVVGHWGGLS